MFSATYFGCAGRHLLNGSQKSLSFFLCSETDFLQRLQKKLLGFPKFRTEKFTANFISKEGKVFVSLIANIFSMRRSIIFLLGIFIYTGIKAQNIGDLIPEYLRQVNAGKKEWQRIKVIDYDNRYGWARLNKAGTDDSNDYLFLRKIQGKKYIILVECNCSPMCAPADFVFFKVGNYGTPVADPIDWNISIDAAKEIMKSEKDYELYYLPHLYSDNIYVVAKVNESASLEMMLDEDVAATSKESDFFKKCIYDKKTFKLPEDNNVEYIGYYIIDEKLGNYRFIRRK